MATPPDRPNPPHPQSESQCQLAFVLDIDGCLSHEGIPIPGSKSALHKLQSTHTPFVVCTNGGGQLESTRAHKLSQTFELFDRPGCTPISPDQVIVSHTPLNSEVTNVVNRRKDDRVLIVGENCGEVARAYGLTKAEGIREYGRRHPSLFPRRREAVKDDGSDGGITCDADDADDPVKAVLFFEDPEDLGEALQLVLDVLLTNGNPSGRRILCEIDDYEGAKQQVEMWFTNPDFVYSGLASHPRLTQGSYRLCLETLFESATSGRKLQSKTVGKPTLFTGKTALSKLLMQCPSGTMEEDLEIWTVGDNPRSDVALAHAMGWKSALVKTGIWKGDLLELGEGMMPTKVVDSLGVLIEDFFPE